MKITRFFRQLFALSMPVIALTVFSSCEDEVDPPAVEYRNLDEVAASNSNFSTLVGAVQVAGLEETKSGSRTIYLICP